ncbi:MAG: ABC transporter permease [Pseudohongiellaceae bacterium]
MEYLKEATFVLRRAIAQFWPYLFLVIFIVMAILSPWISPFDPDRQHLLARLKAPGFEVNGGVFWLGSDELGRDVLSRVIYGARISVSVAFLSVIFSGVAGTALGMLAGHHRGWFEQILMRLVDVFLSIPAILLAILLVAILGPGIVNVILVLSLSRWPRYARVAHAQTLSLANREFVVISNAMGATTLHVLRTHIFPNIFNQILVIATLEFGLMVLFEAGLSFLGLGVQPPAASWGSMLSTGRNYVSTAWWISTFPGGRFVHFGFER